MRLELSSVRSQKVNRIISDFRSLDIHKVTSIDVN